MMSWMAHVGGQAAHSRARFDPTLASVVFVQLLYLNFVILAIEFCLDVVVCFPHTCFPIYLYAQHVETNTYPKRNRE